MGAPAHEPLDAFLGAWCHQDGCTNGETLQDIVAQNRAVARAEDRRALQADIERLLSETQGDVGAGLAAAFDLDIIPPALAVDGEDFLRTICRLLDTA